MWIGLGNEKKALPWNRGLLILSRFLQRGDIGRTWTFLALPDLELHFLAFIERCIAVGPDL